MMWFVIDRDSPATSAAGGGFEVEVVASVIFRILHPGMMW